MTGSASGALDRSGIDRLVACALAEDVGDGDVTTEATVAADARARAVISQKAPGVIYGLDVAEATFRALDPGVALIRLGPEGEWRDGGEVLAIEGRARALLTAERTALNFLQRLSGVATLTARSVRAAALAAARPPVILDTRKTTPGLRALEKAAVRAGGGTNHRVGLYDAILIKENHAALAGGIGIAVARARDRAPGLAVEVECRDLREVDEALAVGADIVRFRILLDNMAPDRLREAVARVGGRVETEASGGFTLETLGEVAATGVDFVSVGALTHSAPALDLSLLLHPLP